MRARSLVAMGAVLVAGLLTTGIAAAAEPVRVDAGLANELGLVRFAIVAGRFFAQSPEIARSSMSNARVGERAESLSINVEERVPSVNYSLSEPDRSIQIDVARGDRFVFQFRRTSGDEPREVTLEQGPTGPLALTIGGGEGAVRRQYGNLWSLLLAEPELGREQLVPLVELLRPQWGLATSAMQIEDTLFRIAAAPGEDLRPKWTALVAQLGDEDFGRRQTADQQLREFGAAVLPFLERLDPARLDAEQRFRLRRIMVFLSSSAGEDRPDAAAGWLAADPQVWAALIDREDAGRRKLAKEQLERILGRAVEFDIDAPAEERTAQAAKLRATLEPGGNP